MTPPSLSSSSTSYTGLVPGWLLSFSAEQNGQPSGDTVEFGTDDYEGDITASLQSGLQGGTYTFVINRLTDDHYRAIKPLKIVKLYLYFRDNPSSPLGYLKNLVGLPGASSPSSSDLATNIVADLRVTSVTRALTDRGYAATIKARERIYDLLTTTSLSASTTPGPIGQTLDFIMQHAQTPLVKDTHYTYYAPAPEPNAGRIRAGTARAQLVTQLANAVERAAQAYGRGMLLIRDGKLHIGKRPIPLVDATDGRLTLDAPSGLVQSERLDAVSTDPGPSGTADSARTRWRLTLSGRPDLKPGDFVTFPTPDGDENTSGGGNAALGMIGAIADIAKSLVTGSDSATPLGLYVETAEHRLSRTAGFSTVLTGVEVTSAHAADAWDTRQRQSAGPVTPSNNAPQQPTGTGTAAAAVNGLINRLVQTREFPDVAEVRAFDAQAADDTRPNQTSRIWEGLQNPPGSDDGGAHQARRLDIDRTSRNESVGVPYVTPVAWGPCGLILPRYPGTRVVVVHRDGDAADAIDIGAGWQDNDGPGTAQLGDYWLTLPAFTSAPSASLADDETPTDYSGNVIHDLIDSAGNRAIETTTFVMRVGAEMLKSAGTRPAVATDPVFSVEHTKNGKTARIAINGDASITIHSDTGLTFETSGDIAMKANNVKVGVSGSMDVSPQ